MLVLLVQEAHQWRHTQDLSFDQLDLVQVLQAAKYMTGDPAIWGEGDWNGGPGGEPGNPPRGDGVFDQFDIIAALAGGKYLTGPYEALQGLRNIGNGQMSDPVGIAVPEPTSIVLLAVALLGMMQMRVRRRS